MLNKIINTTKEYIDLMPKETRKKYGQFFTSKETAIFMANLFDVNQKTDTISILDPGAGSAILSCALIDRLQSYSNLKTIELTCYENDENILELLYKNLDFIKENSKINVNISVITENYITSQADEFNYKLGHNINSKKYDIVIGNPPYMKINKNAPEALSMSSICYGAPNLYFLFMAMSIFNLKQSGELVYIIPRSWTSGAYFIKFREYLLENSMLKHIHLFVSRDKVFSNEKVLQETIIVKIKKETPNSNYNINITTSESAHDFDNITKIKVDSNTIIGKKGKYIYLVTNKEEIEVLNTVNQYSNTLLSIGLKMKTGLTVDFRNKEFLSNENVSGSVPLFYATNIKSNGKISFPENIDNQYILTTKNSLLQENKNYLFVKRFTSKEEKRRLQCGIYLCDDYPNYIYISTHNKINFIDSSTIDLTKPIVYGLYVIFNSTIYDLYYRILNGSTQVNSTEINSMPMPSLEIIEELGNKLIKSNDLSQKKCDEILEEIYEQKRTSKKIS